MGTRARASRPVRSTRKARIDLIAAGPTERATLASAFEDLGLRVVEHLPGIEAQFDGSRDDDPDCIVIVHEPGRLDALVLAARLRAIGLEAPIAILRREHDETFWRLARAQNAEVIVDGVLFPRQVAGLVSNMAAGGVRGC